MLQSCLNVLGAWLWCDRRATSLTTLCPSLDQFLTPTLGANIEHVIDVQMCVSLAETRADRIGTGVETV